MPISQEQRYAKVESPLGEDALLFYSIRGSEEVGRLYEYQLEVVSQREDVAAKDLLGKLVKVHVTMSDGSVRNFSGYVSEFRHDEEALSGQFRYALTLVPWLWFLTRVSDCRIFQNKTTMQIVKDVLKKRGFTAVKDKVTGSQPPRVYCVQYRETDFNFISRLLEEEGIFYFFKDGEMVLMNDAAGVAAISGLSTLKYYPPENIGRRDEDHVYSWVINNKLQSAKYVLKDFNFTTPATDLKVDSELFQVKPPGGGDQYDYPGVYEETGLGKSYAKTRIEALQAEYERYYGESNAFNIAVGETFTLAQHPRASFNQKYLVTGINFWVQSNEYTSSSAGGGSVVQRMAVSAIKSGIPFRAAQRTPKPVMRGPQTAIVVGPKGDEIYTDKYGRVMVAFHWDRETKRDETSSCWIRVSQAWAGKAWGGIMIPRIGQEVIVDFLEGDPDQPIITGRVYNADQTVPYSLPDNMTRSGVQSRSTKGAGTDNFNEIYMEDKKGSELLSIRAEKDMKTVVENSSTIEIGMEKKSPGNLDCKIYNNRTTAIEQGNETFQVKKGNQEDKIDMGNRTTTLGMGNDTLTIKMGNQETKINLGKSATEAMQSIELKVGSSSIKIDQMGVTIKGMMIKIEGTMQTQVKGLMTQVNGDAMLTVKGGITMIN
jgi:type VI secretion system secreted protein VgrG